MIIKSVCITTVIVWVGAAALSAEGRSARETSMGQPGGGSPEGRQRGRAATEHTERFTRTMNIGPSGELALANFSGNIVVRAGSGSEVKLDITKRVRTSDAAEAKRQLSAVNVDVVELPSRGEVRVIYPIDETRPRVSVDYNVTVPPETSLNAKSVFGSVRIADVRGEVRAESVSGNVAVSGADRLYVAKSVSGNIDISRAEADHELSVSSVSGRVTTSDVRAGSLHLSTVSGDIMLNDVACNRLNVESVSGSLQYNGALAKNSRFQMKTHSGNIGLALVGDTGFELDAASFSGGIQSEFPLTPRGRARNDGAGSSRGRGTIHSIRGVYGDGSATVETITFSGNVDIVKKK